MAQTAKSEKNTTENIYHKLQAVRNELDLLKLKKSGKNKFSNFTYYELGDFLPALNKLNREYGLLTQFWIEPAQKELIGNSGNFYEHQPEMAFLQIINADDPKELITYQIPTAEVEIGKKKDGSGGAEPVQNLGGKTTYMRRYLFMIAFEIAESDWVDPEQQAKENQLDDLVADQVANAKDLDDLANICSELKKSLSSNKYNALLKAYALRKAELQEGVA